MRVLRTHTSRQIVRGAGFLGDRRRDLARLLSRSDQQPCMSSAESRSSSRAGTPIGWSTDLSGEGSARRAEDGIGDASMLIVIFPLSDG